MTTDQPRGGRPPKLSEQAKRGLINQKAKGKCEEARGIHSSLIFFGK